MTRLIRLMIDNPLLVAVAVLAAIGLGWHSIRTTPVDAIPDISENQAIVFTQWPGRSPQDVENQITYPLSRQLEGIAGVDEVRGLSGFGFSQIYVVFADDVDFYWARTRVMERLQVARRDLPAGVEPQLGPDATPLGQIYGYTLEGPGLPLATLRSLQDFVVKPALSGVDGVSEVASVGGFLRQYQVDVDPQRLEIYGLGIDDLRDAIRRANIDVGAKTLERSGMEQVIRGRGFLESLRDVEEIVVASRDGVPVFVRHVAEVHLGSEFRRGALADEHGERVGGVVTMRFGENPREVIERVRDAIEALEPALPPGTRIVSFYDRTTLVDETMGTLKTALSEEMLVTVLVVLLFLLNFRASLIVAVTLPLGVLLAFIAMRLLDVGSNIMSLAGIAIAIGTMVDMGIVLTENIYSALREHDGTRSRAGVVADAAAEVAPAVIVALATTVVSFLPVFLLTGQAGKLFTPLAWTKTFALCGALVVALGVLPPLCHRFLKSSGRRNPVTTAIHSTYEPLLRWVLQNRLAFSMVPATIVLLGLLQLGGARFLTAPLRALAELSGGSAERVAPLKALDDAFPPMGSAFMPPLDEGSLLFMPSLLHQASLTETLEAMLRMNRAMREVPEVAQVMGKLGRAETALDPAPVGMIETVVNLKPRAQWRPGLTKADILAELREKTAMLGVSPSWLQPIETRVVMLQSGLRASMALEIIGAPRKPDGSAYTDLQAHQAIERVALALEPVVREVKGCEDVSALRLSGKPYLELVVDRERAGRYGMNAGDVLEAVEVAIGGKNLTYTLEGRERYPVRARYARELRDDPEELRRLLVPTRVGVQVPLGRLVTIREVIGPASVRTRDGELTGYVMFNAADGHDEAGVMRAVRAAVDRWRASARAEEGHDPVPGGLRIEPAGRYLDKIEADRRLLLIVPLVILVNLFLLYLAYQEIGLTLAIFAAIPITFAGGFIGLWVFPLLTGTGPIHLTTAVWIGFIALFGIAVDDGAVMATYLKQTFAARKPRTVAEVREAVVDAGLRRIRPCLMTTFTTIFALVPVLWSTGRGSDVMQPMALPLVGGMLAELVSLFVVPATYAWIRERRLEQQLERLSAPVIP